LAARAAGARHVLDDERRIAGHVLLQERRYHLRIDGAAAA
jgi:hypothetical protein